MPYSKPVRRRFAAADIGSNTVHLLVGDVDDRGVRRLENSSEWLSLGEVVERYGEIPKKSADDLVLTLKRFNEICASYKADKPYIFATEAFRKASNHEEIAERVKEQLGLTIDVIAPARETYLGLKGALIDSQLPTPTLFLECGGGSIQVALYDGEQVVQQESLPLGTGTLIALSECTQPATDEHVNRLEMLIDSGLDRIEHFERSRAILCGGGVARGIMRALHPDGYRRLHMNEVAYLAWSTQNLTIERIVRRFGVKPKRAETLLPGAIVFRTLLERTGHNEFMVSEFGVREGALIEMYEASLEKCET